MRGRISALLFSTVELNLKHEMLHILTITVRQIMHAFAVAIKKKKEKKKKKKNEILMFHRIFKNEGNLVRYYFRYYFVFWKKNLWALFVLHNKEI